MSRTLAERSPRTPRQLLGKEQVGGGAGLCPGGHPGPAAAWASRTTARPQGPARRTISPSATSASVLVLSVLVFTPSPASLRFLPPCFSTAVPLQVGRSCSPTLLAAVLTCGLPVSVLTSPLPLCCFFFLFSNTPGPDSLEKSELQPYSVQVWFQGQY